FHLWFVRGSGFRYWIDAAGMPRVAAQQAPQGKIASAQAAVKPYGFDRVLRAAGVETTTGTEKRTDRPLVAANQADQYPVHVRARRRQCRSRAAKSCALSTRGASLRASTTMS